MEAAAGVCNPTICPNRKVPEQGQGKAGNSPPGGPSLAHTGMVSSSFGVTCPNPNPATSIPRSAQRLIRPEPPSSAGHQLGISCVCWVPAPVPKLRFSQYIMH